MVEVSRYSGRGIKSLGLDHCMQRTLTLILLLITVNKNLIRNRKIAK